MKILEKQCVLAVDNHRQVLNFIKICLQGAGYNVLICLTGEEALMMVEVEEPDIIILDVLMPGMNGFEFLRRLRRFTSVPVIAISTDDSVATQTLSFGATQFMSKPFRTDDLVAIIGTILTQNRQERVASPNQSA